MKVLKFGGSSVRNAERITGVTSIVRDALEQDSVAVVVSALGGVTDLLLEAAAIAESGAAGSVDSTEEQAFGDKIQEIERRHHEAAEALASQEDLMAVRRRVGEGMAELKDLLRGVDLLGECSPRTRDKIVSFGERLSAVLVAAALRNVGIDAEDCDARELIRTDDAFGQAMVEQEVTYRNLREHFANNRRLQVVTGFIARGPDGETTTLGRSGSDLTAALVGAALDASAIEIWTDVDGVMSTDPRLVPEAFSLPTLTYEELMELSHFGAKVVFPPTVSPARERNIPLLIKNTLNPSFPGTRIDTRRADGEELERAIAPNGERAAITGIASISQVTMISLEGEGMMGVPGIAARLFDALAAEKISIILISQASSEHSICFAIAPAQTAAAAEAVSRRFKTEMEHGLIDPLTIEEDCSVVAIVGETMRRRPGISGRLFRLLGRRNINVRAIAQGSSERNISLIIGHKDEVAALRAIHESFFHHDDRALKLFVAGVGGVGSALVRQLRERIAPLAVDGIDLRVIGLASSRHCLFDSSGLSLEELADDVPLRDQLAESGVPNNLETIVDDLKEAVGPRALVDCTASGEIAALYPTLLSAGVRVVTANKVSLAGPIEKDPRTLNERPTGLYYEATAGAGLPIVRTAQGLVGGGDQIHRIEGAFSGTLSFLMSALRSGETFSAAVKEADRLGYTEPDPREDLSGMDVARKLVILAREAGHAIELSDLTIEPLYDPSFGDLSIEEFWQRLPELDAGIAKQLEEADTAGKTLSYLASFTVDPETGKATGRVGLEQVEMSHPAASVVGTDNLFAFTTRYYDATPMVVRGPGAGTEVTAGGLFADILRAHAESVRSGTDCG